MPFEVAYDDHIPQDFEDLPEMQKVFFRMLIGSFRHDRWLSGRPVPGPSSTGTELRELANGPISLVYELNRAEESVFILAIVRN